MRDVEALLIEGQRRGELREFDADTMAVVIRSTLDGALRLVRAGADPAALREELVATIDRAIRR